MAESSDQIKQHIEGERGALSANLNELEYRVKNAVDWRAWFNDNVAAALGVAFGIGLVLAFAGRGKHG